MLFERGLSSEILYSRSLVCPVHLFRTAGANVLLKGTASAVPYRSFIDRGFSR